MGGTDRAGRIFETVMSGVRTSRCSQRVNFQAHLFGTERKQCSILEFRDRRTRGSVVVIVGAGDDPAILLELQLQPQPQQSGAAVAVNWLTN